jgi:hypothetical protein
MVDWFVVIFDELMKIFQKSKQKNNQRNLKSNLNNTFYLFIN